MEEKEQRVITFKLSAEEADILDGRASQAGMSRSDYLRTVIFAPTRSPNDNLEELLRHLIYIADRTHIAVYYIAEIAGTLPTERLQAIYDEAAQEGVRYLNELPQRIATVQAQLAAQSNTAPPAAEKGAA
jgi:predicted DNA binding CopG/RHH family protein